MKKLFLLLAVVVMAFTSTQNVSAQGWWAGGKLGYWGTKDGGLKTNTFSIEPEAGFDFNKHWSLGGALGFGFEKIKDPSISDESENYTVFTIAPYARYKYFNSSVVTLFVDGGFAVAMGDADGFRVGLTPGIAISLTENFSLLTSVGFLGYSKDYYNGGSGKGYGFSLSSSDVKFGFFYSF